MAPRFHALLLAFPAQGHINPMLYLASTFTSRGGSVTFVDTQRSHSSVLLAAQSEAKTPADLVGNGLSPDQTPLGLGMRFFTISDGLHDSFKLDMSDTALLQLLDGIERQKGTLEELIDSSKTSSNPVSCIVTDAFFPWAQDLAKRRGLPGAVIFTSNATSLHIVCLKAFGRLTREAVEQDELQGLQNVRISKQEMLAFLSICDAPGISKVQEIMSDGLGKASHILVNSFRELEAFLNLPEPLASKTSFVGPLLPAELLESKPRNDVHEGTSIFRQNFEYIRWLDMQGERSVLFVSFGSVVAIPPAQIQELAAGIEESELKFLWVARPDPEGKTHLPEGFEERTKDRSRVIPWAQQLEVLQHPATGGFLTHCGWNSTLESIVMGVPMLCLPVFAEQPINKDLMVDQWQLGMALQNSDGKLSGEHVKRAAKELMEGNEGKEIRERVMLWKAAARQAVSEGGSSYVALNDFIDSVTHQHS